MTVDASGNVTSYDDYYPYGMVMEGRSGNFGQGDTRYKFTGKERDVETGYDYFGARYYDSRVGRWLSVDPLAEKYPSLSPYNYAANNPIILLDPNGKEIKYCGSVKEQSQIKMWVEQIKSTSAGREVIEFLERPGFVVEIGFGNIKNPKETGLTTSKVGIKGNRYSYMGSKIVLDNHKPKFRKRITTSHELRHAYQAAIDPKEYIEQSDEDATKSYNEKLYEQDAFFFESTVEDQYKQNDKSKQEINNNYYFPSPEESPGNIHYTHSQTFLIHNLLFSEYLSR